MWRRRALLKEKYPDVLLLVDAVSSMGGVKIDGTLGIDAVLHRSRSVRLPPAWPSPAFPNAPMRAPKRWKTAVYFDMVSLLTLCDKPYQSSYAALAHLFAADYQLDRTEEGLENRFERHRNTALYVRQWARSILPFWWRTKVASQTLTTIVNTRDQRGGFERAGPMIWRCPTIMGT